MLSEFRNEPTTDFSLPENAAAMERALAQVEARFGEQLPLLIGGERVKTKEKRPSLDPGKYDRTVGFMSMASEQDVDRVLDAATKACEPWRKTPPEARARHLLKAAAIMRRRRHELSAWMVFEVGKAWSEADADVAEAIDFCEFYAREMIRLGAPQAVTPLDGHDSELHYIPLGVGVVIPPWNFPLAIATGMTTASLVSGNPTILKPASVSPVIAWKLAEILEETGLPPGVLNFITGSGATVGDRLVKDARTRHIAFTGSKEVGLGIADACGKIAPGQKWIKRAILEMGGKDAIVVDSELHDLDDAVAGIVTSAFGFQGQKCSACSRVIAHEKVYDELVKKVAARTDELTLGHTRDRANQVGPVIDKASYEKTLEYIEIGKREGRLVAGGKKGPDGGFYIRPTVIADVDRKARIFQEEIFAPVLAVTRARSFDHAIELANDSEFGLTGAVYSRNRAHLEQARRDFHVGNLYFNRKCTGALVGVHPFGGFNMSGTDSKAGGKDYLLLFTQAKAICEKL
ncbi:L-glutamate gamma-semialdehyde dehydrogenase [bacterium]|nr:L-glutamate gamma-semialdehyde dehydrogenase [bacterium]